MLIISKSKGSESENTLLFIGNVTGRLDNERKINATFLYNFKH